MIARQLLFALFLVVLTTSGLPAQDLSAQVQQSAEGGVLADRILAVVDEDPILASDLRQVVALGLAQQQEGESEELFQRRLLDRLIEDRLRFHEVDRFGFEAVPASEIDNQIEAIDEAFTTQQSTVTQENGPQTFDQRLEQIGIDRATLREIVARQLMILAYVEERLGARVFVSLADIQNYYDNELVPEMERLHTDPPALTSVREEIRALLREQRLNEEIDGWTQELRERADILDYLDSEHSELPPVIGTFDSPASDG